MEIEAFFLWFKRSFSGFLLLLINAPVMASAANEVTARAYHADLSGVDRVEAYYDVLRQINRGFLSEPQVRDFFAHFQGFLKQRPVKNVFVLQAMSNLVSGVLASRALELVPFLGDMKKWKTVLDADLRHFALVHGGIVRVSFSQAPGKRLSVLSRELGPSAEFLDDSGLSAFFRLAIRGIDADRETQQIVSGGTSFDLVPLYVNRSGVDCALKEAYGLSFGGDIFAKQPEVCLCGLAAVEPLQVIKRSDIPVYAGEEVFIAHPGCKQWATKIEPVAEDVLIRFENDNLQQALQRIKVISMSLEKLRWLSALQSNFNVRTSEKNISMLFKILSGVFGHREKFGKQELIEARNLLSGYKHQKALSAYDKYFAEWLRDINNLLEAHAVRFGDTVTIKNAERESKVFCVAPYVMPAADGYAQEARLGLGEKTSFSKKQALVSLVSSEGKLGPIKFGDEIELSVAYVQDAEMRAVVVQGGEKSGARICLMRVEDVDSEADSVFVVEHSLGSFLKGSWQLVAGDFFLLRSKKTNQILAASRDGVGLWQPLEGKSDLQVKKEQAWSSFFVEAEADDVVQKVVQDSFYDHLASIRKVTTFLGKIMAMSQLLDFVTPRISEQERGDFWDMVFGLAAEKKYMNEEELVRLESFLQKVIVVAKENNFMGWVKKADSVLKDLSFHKKMKKALEFPGMDRFKALLELTPLLKGVSASQSQVFLDELAALRRYKKDQSRAAKLLLMHASDEFGQDFKTTGSGNLLVP